jgi:2-C-methyl-D-erythritol 2,4-cyclodiphosphate synthase
MKGGLPRVGIGYDVHALIKGRRLILAGVEIAHEMGLDGHSDADVVAHAVMDALLGAASLPDIGCLFPDTDMAYKNADSLMLLAQVGKRLAEAGYGIGNVDVVLMAEAPKVAGYVPQMCEKLAAALGIETGNIGLKATTTEALGFVGRREGMAAQAVCLVFPLED